jgi:uncharacterized protein (TIGR02246 family)
MTRQYQDTVENCLERIRLAWNAGNADAFASEFTEDATYVIFLGEPLLGRKEIRSTHADVFGKWQKGTQMAIKVLGVRSLSADVASILTAGGIGKGRDIPFDKLQTFTLIRRDGRWRCTAFQNTAMSRRAKRTHNSASNTGILGTLRAWVRGAEDGR